MSSFRSRSLLLMLAGSLLIIACGGDGGTGPGQTSHVPARIVLAPGGPDTLNVGATQQLAATVYTADDAVLSGQHVTYSSSDSDVALPNNSGLITAPGKYGAATVTATVSFSGGSVSTSVRFIVFDISRVNVPVTITLAQPISSSVSVGESTPVSVKVTDVYGNPATSATVNFSVQIGTGAVSPTGVQTDANGIATTTWTVGTVLANGNAITAHAGDVYNTFNCTPLPGPATSVAMTFPFAGFTVGNSIDVSVLAYDTYTNQIASPAAKFTIRDSSLFNTPGNPFSSELVMTSKAAGQTYIVGAVGDAVDSTLVAVFPVNGALVSAPPPGSAIRAGMTFTVPLRLSTGPSTPQIGSLTATITWDPTVLTYISDTPTSDYTGSAVVNRSNVANGSLTIGVASGTSMDVFNALRVVTFTAASVAGRHGTLGVTISEISTTDFTSLLPVTQVVTFPVRTR